MKWWIVFALGAVLTLTPGMVNPLAVVNGSTLIGLGLLALASVNIAKGK
jgi:hypothetical protein